MIKTQRRSVFWLIIFRTIVITSLLVSAVIIQASTSVFLPLSPFYILILHSYGLVLVFLILYFLWNRHHTFQAYVQIVCDLFLITAFVYITGGMSGALYFLYVFAIIAASLVISARAGYVTAALSAILFGALVDGMYYKIIPYFRPDQYRQVSLGLVFYTIFLAWGLFFVIAFLVNSLAGKLKRAKEELLLAQKELQIKERQAEAGRISAQIAHEIRNPLAAISGSVQVLKNELRLNEEQKELMDIILRESERVSQSIEQFLDLAAPRKQALSFIDLSKVLDETLTLFQRSGELDGRFRITGNYQSSNVHYYGYSFQFKQAFWNIIKNSLKAMPDGGTMTIDVLENKKSGVVLRFADTGRGMSEEDKERIFEPFYSSFDNGRGLGMAVVHRIVSEYHGDIKVNSEQNKGTEVVITLPAPIKRMNRPLR